MSSLHLSQEPKTVSCSIPCKYLLCEDVVSEVLKYVVAMQHCLTTEVCIERALEMSV